MIKRKPQKNRRVSKFLPEILALKKKHGDFINFTQIGKQVGTSRQNAESAYRTWQKKNGMV